MEHGVINPPISPLERLIYKAQPPSHPMNSECREQLEEGITKRCLNDQTFEKISEIAKESTKNAHRTILVDLHNDG